MTKYWPLLAGLACIPSLALATEEQSLPVAIKDRPGAEEQTFKPTFFLDVGVGYGASYAATAGFSYVVPENNRNLEIYLERLGLGLSENGVTLRLTGTYSLSKRLSIYSVVPYGMVSEKADTPLPGLVEVEVAPGDIGFGLNYSLLTATERRPSVVLNLDYSTNTSKHTSLGNGVNDLIGGVSLSKYVSDRVFITGRADYAARGEKNGVDVGDDMGVGLGLGLLYGSNRAKIHFQLKYTATGDSTLGQTTLLPAHEDLSLTMSSYVLADRSNVSMYIARLNDLAWTTSEVGFNWNIRMLPR